MSRYAVARIVQMVPVLFIVSAGVFMIVHLIPGDPAQIMAGPNATDQQLSALRSQFGLEQPLWLQYLIWLRNVLAGDLGYSYINKYPVVGLMLARVPATFELALVSILLGVAISFPLGVLAALRRGSLLDHLCTLLSAVSFAVPGFWLAILLVLVFSLGLHWLPPSGRPDVLAEPVEHLRSLVLPALTLGIGVAARLMPYLRSAVLDALAHDYTRTARSKGLREQVVMVRHVLPNALIPVVTVLGLQMGDLLSGAIVVEMIFAWPGVGRLTIQAIGWRDYALLQADVLFIVIAFLLINLLTDLAYGAVDPRIRLN
ncbi:MAG: ABC transporter permease [Chloroflexota bacterium]